MRGRGRASRGASRAWGSARRIFLNGQESHPGKIYCRYWGVVSMTFSDLVRMSFRQIIRHRRRYWGVILAISLGIAGLITVIMASRDFKRNLNHDLTLIGGVTVIKASFDNHLTYRPML